MLLHKHGQVGNPARRVMDGEGLLPLQEATGAGGNHCPGRKFNKVMHEPVTDPPGNIRVDDVEETAMTTALRTVFKFQQDQPGQTGQ